MNFKRSVTNYIIWGLLCIIVFAGIGVSAIGVSEAVSNPAYLMYVGIFYAIFIFGIAIIAIGFKTLRGPIGEKIDFENVKLEGILEIVFVFVAAITALIVRFSAAITLFMDGGVSSAAKGTGAYLEYVLGSISNLGTGENGAYIFTGIVKILFSVFGENIVSVYVMQALFSLGIMIFVFYALRNSVGRIPAWIAMLLIAFLPSSVSQFMYCTPSLLYGFLLSIYFFAIEELFRFFKKGKIDDNKYLVLYGLAGVFAGFLAYYDISGLLLIPVTIYSFYNFKTASPKDKYDNPGKQSLWFALGALGFLLIGLFAFPAGSPSGMTGIVRYGMLFIPRSGIDITVLAPFYGTWDSAFVYMIAGFWLLEFVKTKKDRVFPFAILIIAMVLFHFLTLDHINYDAAFSMLFIIIGAIGLRFIPILFVPVEAESDEALAETMIEIENKRKEKANKKFAKKIEKQNKQGKRSRSKVITLGNYDHAEELAREAEEAKAKAEAEAADAAENTVSDVASENAKEAMPVVTFESILDEYVANAVRAAAAENGKTEEEPVSAEPVAEETAVEIPIVEEPAVEIPVVEEPAVEIPVAEEPVVEIPVAEEPVAEIPVAEEPVAETPAAPAKPINPDLPPYKPAKMAFKGRRGKMFSPVKKAEVELENNPEFLNAPMVNQMDELALAQAEAKQSETEAANIVSSGPDNLPAEEIVSNEVASTEVTTTEVAVNEVASTNVEIPVNETELSNTVFEPPLPENTPTVNEITETEIETTVIEAVVAKPPVAMPVSGLAAAGVSTPVMNIVSDTVEESKTVDSTVSEIADGSVVSADVTVKDSISEESTAEVADNTTAEGASGEATENASANSSDNTKMIKNVLPGPKPHVPKELVFDYDPKEDEMDFDLQDLTGKDFYDV